LIKTEFQNRQRAARPFDWLVGHEGNTLFPTPQNRADNAQPPTTQAEAAHPVQQIEIICVQK
jgi:hypothetical protein